MMHRPVVVILFMLIFITTSHSFEPATYFQTKCLSCHTVGQGDDVGPDLKGVTKRRDKQWLIHFIQDSQTLIENGDPIANKLFIKYKKKKMPEHELTSEEAAQLLTYIESGKVKADVKKIRSALDANPFELENGKKLFMGQVKLAKGGPSCITCHSAGDAGVLGGGTLGPDLTNVYTSYNDKGLEKVIRNINFPTMVNLYKNKELTEDEVFQIKSFLWQTDRKEKVDHGHRKKFLFIGILGFLLVLGFFDLLFKSRSKQQHRRD